MDVVVYPPISVADWTVDDLSDRIAEVRQLYLDTLKDWPEDKVPTPDIYRRRPAKQPVPAKKAAAKKAPAKKAATKKAPPRRRRSKVAAKKQPARKSRRQEGSARQPEGSVVNADHLADFSTTDDALVLASVSSKAELQLLDDWLHAQRGPTPTPRSRCCNCPPGIRRPGWWPNSSRNSAAGGPPGCSGAVFWVPGGLPTRVKVVGLISGRDTYRPPEFLQRSILRKGSVPRAYRRRRAGQGLRTSPAVAEKTVGDSLRDFARFVLRRGARPSSGWNCGCSGRNTSRRI